MNSFFRRITALLRIPSGTSKATFQKQTGAPAVVVFVHGLTGDAETTWGRFPALIATDPELNDFDVFLWGYPSQFVGRMPDISQAASQLETELRVRLDGYASIVLTGHSLGGLLIRALIINALEHGRMDTIKAVKHIVTFATPNDGSELAHIAKLVGIPSAQLQDLDITGKTVTRLRTDWINRVYNPVIHPGEERTKKKIPLTAVVGLEDGIVTFESASSFFQDPPPETVPGSHTTMKLPQDRESTCYRVLKKTLLGITGGNPGRTLSSIQGKGQEAAKAGVAPVNSLEPPVNVSRTHAANVQDPEAERLFQETLSKLDTMEKIDSLGRDCIEFGQWRHAMDVYNRLAEIARKKSIDQYAHALEQLGRIYWHEGADKEADEAWNASLRLYEDKKSPKADSLKKEIVSLKSRNAGR